MRATTSILLFILLISCDSTKKSDELNTNRTTEEIQQMLAAYHKDISEEGLTAEFTYLDDSADFFWVPPGYHSALSYDSVKTILEANSKAFHSVQFQWDTLQIVPLKNDIANYSGIVKGHMIDTAGIESKVSILESGTLIKREEGWKLLSGQSRLIEPEAEAKSY